jgi:hypothetical protein
MLETSTLVSGENASPTLQTILPSFDSVAGWLSLADTEELFRAAAAAETGCIVEVGSYRGRSTLALCAGSSVGAKLPVYAIEPHEEAVGVFGAKFGPKDRAAFFGNFYKTDLVRYVRLVNTTSTIATGGWKERISLLFIDGDRRYKSVRADFAAWQPHLAPGATVAFADPGTAGPRKVIEWLVASNTLEFLRRVNKVAFYRFLGHQPRTDEQTAGQKRMVATPVGCAHDADYKVSWNDIGYGVYYGGDGKYLYQPITKCACTTIKTILLEFEGLAVDENEWRRHQKKFNKFPGTDHLSDQKQFDIFEGRTNTFKFVIIRNPYTRLASVYNDKILLNKPHWVNLIRKSAATQGVGLSDTISFEEFVTVVSRQSLEEMDPHWRPQYYEGRFGTIKYDFVGRVEMMPDSLTYVLERIGAPDWIIERSIEKHNVTGAGFDLWEAVSPGARKLFLNAFAIDFDALHFSQRLPIGR